MSAWMKPPLALRVLVHVAIYAAAALIIAPILWMLATSLKTAAEAISPEPTLFPKGSPDAWQWSNYVTAWRDATLGDFYLNSLFVAAAVTVLSVAHNALAGHAFAKLRFTGSRAAFALMIATMLLPMQAYFIFAYVLCGWLGYVDSWQALVVPSLASAFGIFYMRQSIAALPESLLEAGRLDGMGELDAFVHLVLPSIRPATGALAIFTFMASWNAFFWPLIVIDREEWVTLPLAVARLSAGYYVPSWPVQMAAASIITVPTIVVFLVFQRRFVRGLALTAGKG